MVGSNHTAPGPEIEKSNQMAHWSILELKKEPQQFIKKGIDAQDILKSYNMKLENDSLEEEVPYVEFGGLQFAVTLGARAMMRWTQY